MKVAIPLFGMRVSPRCSYSEKMLLAQISDKRVVSRKIIDTVGMLEHERLSQLVDLEIDVFVCGAIDQEFIERANSYGIKVIYNVAAEVDEILTALTEGVLRNGYGLTSARDSEAILLPASFEHEAGEEVGIDCVECIDRICLRGESCKMMDHVYPVDEYSQHHRSMEVTADISAEADRKLCRVAEFIYYCIGMGYTHIGVAFCVEMFREVEILTRLLRRFFRVTPVGCKVGGHMQYDLITSASGVLCNPIGQARILNKLKSDINVMVGLCVGCDIIFMQHSEAPVSPLFVKDKSLANNPVSALYSKYYIEEILRSK